MIIKRRSEKFVIEFQHKGIRVFYENTRTHDFGYHLPSAEQYKDLDSALCYLAILRNRHPQFTNQFKITSHIL